MTPLRLCFLACICCAAFLLFTQGVEASVYGGPGLNITPIGGGTSLDTSVSSLVFSVIVFILDIVLIFAILAVIISGIYLIVSGGEEAQKDKAKNIILYCAIGILVVMLSRAIVVTMSSIF